MASMQECIENCLNCFKTCYSMAMTHCLQVGGKHVDPEHFKAMMTCVETCRTCASLMLIDSPSHKAMCQVCAEACEACAASCEGLDRMEECAVICRKCAASCREMAG